jgi:Uma2 family endonuclease
VVIEESYLIPDLVVVTRDRVCSVDYLQPADVRLVVEVVSPSSVTMDRLVKPSKYAAAGISAFWRVETDPVALTAYGRSAGSSTYVEAGTWSTGEVAELAEPFLARIDLAELPDR